MIKKYKKYELLIIYFNEYICIISLLDYQILQINLYFYSFVNNS